MKLLLTNIKRLLQVANHPPEFRKGKDMQTLPSLENAFLYCVDEKIADFGMMKVMPSEYLSSETVFDATGRLVLPGFCDPHTHLVYSGSREMEYIDKIKGLSYEEIARKGGGILNSAKLLHNTSEDELFEQSSQRVRAIMNQGTCSVEIKSGYGLNTQDELKMLRVIRRIRNEFPLNAKYEPKI